MAVKSDELDPLGLENTISHRGVRAWLQDDDGNRIPLGHAVIDGGKVTTVVQVKKTTCYSIGWCKTEDGPALNARCEILRPSYSGRNMKVRIGHHFMAADDEQTQTQHFSKNNLGLPLKIQYTRFLEIRRLREPPKETQRMQDNKLVREMVFDYLDNPEQGLPPFITFQFEFSTKPNNTRRKTRAPPSPRIIKKSCAESDPEHIPLPDLELLTSRHPSSEEQTQEHMQVKKRSREDHWQDDPDLSELDQLLKKQVRSTNI
ncbi:hypothetical protein GGX14DRAFT_430452 [Mycena pura]|uniref:Uncharacterized protein n=1 Tax=Mycena pura TaxID=153505 RepID=A0AAD6VSX2_9AGAR|nr:hypothetical protein GGX14DRAFT_430452 [Mycena pura]